MQPHRPFGLGGDWQLKNESFQSRGWRRVPADECTQVINESLSDRYYFYYAEAVGEDGRLLRERDAPKFGAASARCAPSRHVLPLRVKKIAWRAAMTDMALPASTRGRRAVGRLIWNNDAAFCHY